MSILKIKDENGNFIPIYTIKGDKGEPGNDYILTEEDKEEIANKVTIPAPEVNIPEWAQQETKPQYTAEEVGAVPIARKIADIDLIDDVTVEELQDSLKTYPVMISNVVPDYYFEGGVGQLCLLKTQNKYKIYFCERHGTAAATGKTTYIWREIDYVSTLRAIAGLSLENDISVDDLKTALGFENLADKSYVDNIVDSVNSALDEIHAYAQGIISGGVTE